MLERQDERAAASKRGPFSVVRLFGHINYDGVRQDCVDRFADSQTAQIHVLVDCDRLLLSLGIFVSDFSFFSVVIARMYLPDRRRFHHHDTGL